MPPIIQDAFDIARFRVKTLEHYVYDWWQPVLWLTALAALPAFTAIGRVDQLGSLMLLAVALNWVQALVFTFFFGWWIKKDPHWQGQGTLFPLIVLSTTAQLSGLLLAAVPDGLLILAMLAVLFYQFAVLIHALATATGVPKKHLVNGLLIYLLVCVAISMVLAIVAVQAGWISAPPPAAAPARVPGLQS